MGKIHSRRKHACQPNARPHHAPPTFYALLVRAPPPLRHAGTPVHTARQTPTTPPGLSAPLFHSAAVPLCAALFVRSAAGRPAPSTPRKLLFLGFLPVSTHGWSTTWVPLGFGKPRTLRGSHACRLLRLQQRRAAHWAVPFCGRAAPADAIRARGAPCRSLNPPPAFREPGPHFTLHQRPCQESTAARTPTPARRRAPVAHTPRLAALSHYCSFQARLSCQAASPHPPCVTKQLLLCC